MVLSQRHHILHHYMEKAGGKKLFHGEREGGGEEEGSVSGEEVEGTEVSGEGVESEAEEVMVCYGEEDKEEMEDSQSIGEPWDWGEEEVMEQEVSQEQEVDTQEMRTIELDIVSPSLLVSVCVCVLDKYITPTTGLS